MAVSHARLVTILLVLGSTHLLASSSAAQDIDASPAGIVSPSPSIYAGLFQRPLTLPGEEGGLSREVLTRATAFQATAPKPDQPAHTGFSALARAIGSDFKAFPRRKSTWVILAIGGAAAAAVHPADDAINEKLQASSGLEKAFKPGKFIGSTGVQVAGSVGTYLIGRYAKPGGSRTNKWSHIGFDLLRAQVVSSTLMYGMKQAVRRDRPTGACCSFPSGHSTVAFATASVLERHFGYRGSWPMWIIASYVATSRLIDNRHFASDVVFGAALGIASGWTVVGRHGRDAFVMTPLLMRGGAGVTVTWQPPAARPVN